MLETPPPLKAAGRICLICSAASWSVTCRPSSFASYSSRRWLISRSSVSRTKSPRMSLEMRWPLRSIMLSCRATSFVVMSRPATVAAASEAPPVVPTEPGTSVTSIMMPITPITPPITMRTSKSFFWKNSIITGGYSPLRQTNYYRTPPARSQPVPAVSGRECSWRPGGPAGASLGGGAGRATGRGARESRASLADAAREPGVVLTADRASDGIDVGALLQSLKRKVAGESAIVVGEFVQLAVGQHLPVPHAHRGDGACGGLPLREKAGGAVFGDRVVPLGPLVELVDAVNVLEKAGARAHRVPPQMVEVDVFSGPVVRSQPHDVALVGGDVNQLVLAEKAEQSGIVLAHRLAGFHGESDVVVVSKREADHRMRNPRRAPVDDIDVAALQLGELVGARLPAAGVIELGAVLAIAHIVDHHVGAVYVCPGGLRDVLLPVARARRLEGKPPHEDGERAGEAAGQPQPGPFDDKQDRHEQPGVHGRGGIPRPATHVHKKRGEAPQGQEGNNEPCERKARRTYQPAPEGFGVCDGHLRHQSYVCRERTLIARRGCGAMGCPARSIARRPARQTNPATWADGAGDCPWWAPDAGRSPRSPHTPRAFSGRGPWCGRRAA